MFQSAVPFSTTCAFLPPQWVTVSLCLLYGCVIVCFCIVQWHRLLIGAHTDAHSDRTQNASTIIHSTLHLNALLDSTICSLLKQTAFCSAFTVIHSNTLQYMSTCAYTLTAGASSTNTHTIHDSVSYQRTLQHAKPGIGPLTLWSADDLLWFLSHSHLQNTILTKSDGNTTAIQYYLWLVLLTTHILRILFTKQQPALKFCYCCHKN